MSKENFTSDMNNLIILDLSRNNLTTLPTINPEVKNLRLDASGIYLLFIYDITTFSQKLT